MTVIALVFSLGVAALGVLGVASPSKLLRLEEDFRKPPARYIASAIRLLMGVALFLAAPTSRAAGVLSTLGVFIFLAGVITLFFGPERFRRLVDWWSAQGPKFARVWAALALALGVFLVYALVR
jgi:membrane-bound ClpP family serine protease